jgi:hypothetical protein
MSVGTVVSQDRDLEARIRARAHEIWEHEGRPSGRAELHWEQARREIQFEAAREQTAKPLETSAALSSLPRSRRRKAT